MSKLFTKKIYFCDHCGFFDDGYCEKIGERIEPKINFDGKVFPIPDKCPLPSLTKDMKIIILKAAIGFDVDELCARL